MTKIYSLKHPDTLEIKYKGILLNTYISLSDAAEQTGLLKGNLSSACTGRLKTYGGFIWKYKS